MFSTPQDFASILIPKPCPYPLIRIGGETDGAYLVPDDLQGVKACFSPGVQNFKRFEDELTLSWGLDCHLCDYSSDAELFATPLIPGKQTFQKKWLDVAGQDAITLADWVADLSPDENDDLILQMDIEDAEWRNLAATPHHVLQRFRIIVIEMHGLSALKSMETIRGEHAETFRKLDQHFVCVHAHPNNCCGDFEMGGLGINIPEGLELTFLRRDRMTASGAGKPRMPVLPHPLDIGRNVLDKPPLFLNRCWTGGTISEEAQERIEREEHEYFKGVYPQLKRDLAVTEDVFEMAQKLLGTLTAVRPSAQTVDVARGKPFTLSSRYPQVPRAAYVEPQEPFFFHTDFGRRQSITVDLGLAYAIDRIDVRNRTNMCADRARYLCAAISTTQAQDDWIEFPLNVTGDFARDPGQSASTRVPGLVGRYVRVFTPSFTALHLSNLQVFGTPA